MMSFKQWKDGTERNVFTPRSRALKRIDSTFETWEKSKKTTDLIDFSEAVSAWLTVKGDSWRSSTRNSNGTVEKLVKDLAGDPTVGRKFAPLLHSQPVDKSAGIAKKLSLKDPDNHWHTVFFQTEESSCGPACIRNIVHMLHGRDLGEDGLRALVELAEEHGAYAGSLGQGGVVEASGIHNWGPPPDGFGTWHIPEAFKHVDPPINAKQTSLTSTLLTTTRKQPAIAVVSWSNGGKHYVVVAGPLRTVPNRYLVIDPWYGIQTVGVRQGRTLDLYKPVDQHGTVQATAAWDGWVCKVV